MTMVDLTISWALFIRKGHTEDDLWSTVMTGWNYWWMIFIFECSTSEIDKADIGILQDSPGFSTCFLYKSASFTTSWRCSHTLGPANLDSLDTNRMFSGFRSVWTSFNRCRTIVSSVPGWISDGLTINTLQQTLCEILDMSFWEWREWILFQEIKYTHPIQLGDDTGVITMIKVFVHMNTMTIVSLIMGSWTYFVFPGSCRRNVSKTLISILLASLYFWTALMTLMATLRLLSTFLASTTLPNVPWPRRRTILSFSSASTL